MAAKPKCDPTDRNSSESHTLNTSIEFSVSQHLKAVAVTSGGSEKSFILTLREFQRAELLHLAMRKLISPMEACKVLSVSKSHFYRLLKRYRREGLAGIVSKQRHAPSNRAFSKTVRNHVLSLIRSRYLDFGPTLISEMIEEFHGMKISRETIRQWMIKAGFWLANRAARKRAYLLRKRMPAYGDLVQLDGSDHDWFENRAPRCSLMVATDDATGRLQALFFTPKESRRAYYLLMHQYIEAHGRPVRLLTDKHSGVWSGSSKSDFTKAMDSLAIAHSLANSAQSKGRVERLNRTLQDRLVKVFRLFDISSIEEANAYAPIFIDAFNEKFANQPFSNENHHRPMPEFVQLHAVFSEWHRRKVLNGQMFCFNGQRFLIERNQDNHELVGQYVEIAIDLHGKMSVFGPSGNVKFARFDIPSKGRLLN